MTVAPRIFQAALSRSVSPIAWDAFAGAPLSIVGALPTGQDFAGITGIRAELHAEQSNSEAPLAVSDTLAALPTGSTVTLSFSSAALNRAARSERDQQSFGAGRVTLGRGGLQIDPGQPEERNIYDAMNAGKQVKKIPMTLGEALETAFQSTRLRGVWLDTKAAAAIAVQVPIAAKYAVLGAERKAAGGANFTVASGAGGGGCCWCTICTCCSSRWRSRLPPFHGLESFHLIARTILITLSALKLN